jgi:2-desacetyl-2-hydroxyethyl bacteriochlorophyllide A dehydrogenase
MKTQAIIFEGAEQVAFGEIEMADPEPGDAVIRTVATLVSTGTDTRVLRGKQAEGRFPLVPGYSAVGVVEEVLGDVPGVAPGDLVLSGNPRGLIGICRCWGAQAAHCVRPAAGLLKLDDRRPPAEYVFTRTGAIALHGVRRSMAESDDRVVVIGQGLIGQLHARIQAAMGRQVIVSDLLESRLERSLAAGVTVAVNAAERDTVEAVREVWPDGVQVAVEASARQEGLDQCVALVHQPAWGSDERMPVLVVQSSFTEPLVFDYGRIFAKEVVIVPTRDAIPRDSTAAAQMIRTGTLRVDDLITLRARPQEAADAFAELLAHPERHFTCVFEWD